MLNRFMAASWAIGALAIAGDAAAQATTYTFTSGFYSANTAPVNCVVGECSSFNTSQRATITLTFAAPLAANLPYVDRSADVIAYTFSDGLRTTTGPGPNAALFTLKIATDAAGLPSTYQMLVERTPGPPYSVNNPADPNARFSSITLSQSGVYVAANTLCGSRGPGTAVAGGPGVCDGASDDDNSNIANNNVAPVVTSAPASPASVPTLSEWATILFGTVLAGAAALLIHRRRRAV